MRLMLCLACALAWASAWATDYTAGPGDYRSFLSRLRAGDRLLLAAGDYLRGLPLKGLEGTAERPIVVQGPRDGTPARFLARPGANTVSLVNVSHVTLRYLELDGRNLPVDAVKAEGHSHYAHYVTLEGLYIHDHAANQQNVGISTKCPAFGWVVRGNRIERVGTGMYFGDSDGTDPFVAGLIEDNYVSATLGYNLQVKHQLPRPPMPEPGVRHETVIRHNFFSKQGSAPNPMARPNVLVGHLPLEGEGSEDRYLVYGNLFWQNPSEALFQGEGNIALYDNLFVNADGTAVRIQPHNDVPRHVDVFQNTVLARDGGILLHDREGQPHYPQTITANVVFAATPLAGSWPGNLTGHYDEAPRFLREPYLPLAELDLAPGRPLSPASGIPARYPEADRDFAGLPRPPDSIGACLTEDPEGVCGMGAMPQRMPASPQ
jgi:hypothetical protein